MVRKVLRIVFSVAAVAVGLWLLYILRSILFYLAISGLISLLGQPLMRLLSMARIRGKSIPRGLSAFIVLLFFFGLFAFVMSLFVPLAIEESRLLTNIRWNEVREIFSEQLQHIIAFAESLGFSGAEESLSGPTLRERITTFFGFRDVTKGLNMLLGALGNLFVAVFSVSFITFFFLKDKGIRDTLIESLTPDKYIPRVQRVFENIQRMLRRYIVGLFMQFIVFVAVVSLGLALVGIEQALIIGVIAGLLNVIPYIGPIIGAFVGIMIGMSASLGADTVQPLLPMILLIITVFASAQLLDNLVVQPLVFSASAKAHPLEIYLVILAAGMLGGIVGMILAIPSYIIIRVVAKEFFDEFKFVNRLTRNM